MKRPVYVTCMLCLMAEQRNIITARRQLERPSGLETDCCNHPAVADLGRPGERSTKADPVRPSVRPFVRPPAKAVNNMVFFLATFHNSALCRLPLGSAANFRVWVMTCLWREASGGNDEPDGSTEWKTDRPTVADEWFTLLGRFGRSFAMVGRIFLPGPFDWLDICSQVILLERSVVSRSIGWPVLFVSFLRWLVLFPSYLVCFWIISSSVLFLGYLVISVRSMVRYNTNTAVWEESAKDTAFWQYCKVLAFVCLPRTILWKTPLIWRSARE